MKKEIYPKIVLFWNNDSEELTVYNKTIAEAIDIAVFFGYKRSTWYAPWRYFFGGICVITVGFPY